MAEGRHDKGFGRGGEICEDDYCSIPLRRRTKLAVRNEAEGNGLRKFNE
jgi:hypothetical protein